MGGVVSLGARQRSVAFGKSIAFVAAAAVVMALVPFGSFPARAASRLVCPTGDTDSSCQYFSVSGAIAAASAGDVVQVKPGTYIDSLTLNKSITVQGLGATAAEVVIDASGDGRVVSAGGGASATVENLTLTGGSAGLTGGGGVYIFGAALILDSVHVVGNNATLGGSGGGISVYAGNASLLLRNSTVSGNTINPPGSPTGYGAGIFVSDGASATIENSTVSGNLGSSGINVRASSTAVIDHTTIVNNTFGLAADTGSIVTVKRSVLAGHGLNNDCSGTYQAASGPNFVESFGTDSCPNLLDATSLSGADPTLGSLADNGGATPTHRPTDTSFVVNATDCGPLTTDQRGTARPQGLRCDMGSVEVIAAPNAPPAITPTANQVNLIGDEVSVQIVATDTDGPDALTYGTNGLPSGLTIDSATGLITGTVGGAPVNNLVSITVSDGATTALANFAWQTYSVDASLANDDSVVTARDTPAPLGLFDNDATGPLIIAAIEIPDEFEGAVDCSTGPIGCQFIPGEGFTGVQTFSYLVGSDTSADRAFVTVDTRDMFGGAGSAEVDGTLSSGEWDDAGVFDVVVSDGTDTGRGHLYLMNDADNLYLGLEVEGIDGDGPFLEILFDENGDGNFFDNEDALRFDGQFIDGHSYNTGEGTGFRTDSFFESSNDGAGVVGSGGLVFEIAHPLNTDSSYDVSLSGGDVVPFQMVLQFSNQAETTGYSVVPADFSTLLWQITDGGPTVGVDSISVTVDNQTTGPGSTEVPISSIPIEAILAASASAPSASPLGAVPLGAVSLADSPLGAVPLGAVPLGAVSVAGSPLGAVPLGAVPVNFPGGWTALLEDTPFEGRPAQTILLSEVLAYANTPEAAGSDLASLPLGAVSPASTPLGAVSLASVALGAAPLGAVAAGVICPTTTLTCDENSTLIGLEIAGYDVASAPLGAVPLGAVPLGAVPLGAVPLGAVPLGAVPLGAVPLGAVPLGAVPLGAVPLGAVNLSAADLAGSPLGAVTLDVLEACLPVDLIGCVANGWSATTTVNRVIADSGSGDLASSPLGAVPLGAVPLGAVPLGAVPLGAVPLGAVDIAGSPLGAVTLAAIGVDVCSSFVAEGFTPSCADVGATGSTTLFELAVLVESRGQTLAASPLGAVTLDQLPLGAVDIVAILTGLGVAQATLADIFGTGVLSDVADWGAITLEQILFALVIGPDYPWEELPFDALGVQDFAPNLDNIITYQVEMQMTGGAGLLAVTVDLPAGYRYRTQTSTFLRVVNEFGSPIVDPVVDETAGFQRLTWFLDTSGGSTGRISFDVAPALTLGSSTVSATATGTASNVSATGQAPHTITEPDATSPTANENVLYLGYIAQRDDSDEYAVTAAAATAITSVLLSNLAGDADLVMYQPVAVPAGGGDTAAPTTVQPFEDDGFEQALRGTSEPESLSDIPLAPGLAVRESSDARGTTKEEVGAFNDGSAAGYTVRVSGYNGNTSDLPYVLRVKNSEQIPTPICTPRSPGTGGTSAGATTLAAGLESVFLIDQDRLGDVYGPADATAIIARVQAVVDFLNADATTGSAGILFVDGLTNFASWDANPCDWQAANEIVGDIRSNLMSYATTNESLKYVTIVGGDDVIPFFRQTDATGYANEDTYAAEFSDNALFGSFITRHFLTDAPYGDPDPIPWFERFMYLPEIAVGRLVEEPDAIIESLDTFLEFDGQLDPQTAAVAGYDFLTDGSELTASELEADGYPTDRLINETWTDDELEAQILTTSGATLLSPNAHYDHSRALPAAEQLAGEGTYGTATLFESSELAAFVAANNLSGRYVFTMGCHGGLSVSDIAVAGSSTQSLDWAQTYARDGATYTANTGYGYGDTVTVALSEKLVAGIAANLDGRYTLGQAVIASMNDYWGGLGLYGVYDEKALMELTTYGLPMYQVNGTGTAGEAPTPPPVSVDPITGLTAASFDLTPDVTPNITTIGTYYSADGDTQGIHYRPIQPKISLDATVPGKVAKGAIITALTTSDESLEDPTFFRPMIDDSSREPEIENFDVIFPTTFASIGSYEIPSTEAGVRTERRQNLNLIVGQYIGATTTQRLFTEVGVEVLYVDEAAALDDVAPPHIAYVQGSIVDGRAAFLVDVPAGDAIRGVVLYRDDQSSTWRAAELVSGSPWTGGGPVTAGSAKVDFMVQMIDSSGNVGVSTFKGDFFDALPQPTLPNTAELTVSVEPTPAAGWNSGPVTVTVSGTAGPFTATVDGVATPLNPSGVLTITADGVHFVKIDGTGVSSTFVVAIDTKNPEVFIETPADGAVYEADPAPIANFACRDAGSGIASCTGTVPDGDPLPSTALGAFLFTVTATDNVGRSTSATTSYALVDVELSVTPDLVAVDSTVTATAAVADFADVAPDSAIIEWGDGSSTDVTSSTTPSGALTTGHIYTTPGVYTVGISVTYGSLTISDSFEFVVVYDPAGGFVTGGGWIESPEGAYVADPSLTGRANFGFVSKYKKGKSAPDGNTTFQFKAADFKFESTSYDWLVIAGKKAQFKGSGTINGVGDYGFMLTAIDAALTPSTDVDLFRIKIWNKNATGDEGDIVYDNKLGALDAADPTTAIGGGSIVIHDGKKKK